MNYRKRNYIGHCTEGSSDKVYIVCTVKHDDGTFSCEGRYGRRNGELKVDVKASHVSKATATVKANKLASSKFYRNKGAYIDIDSHEYSGILTRTDAWLQRWLEKERPEVDAELTAKVEPTDKTVPSSSGFMLSVGGNAASKPKPAPKPVTSKPEVLVCINNAGMEDRFNIGMEYFVKKYEDDDFVQVMDKHNEVRSVFRERFIAVEMTTT